MKELTNLFNYYTSSNLIDINNPQFEKACQVHDWRNYVPYEWKDKWEEFTEREKQIIAVMAQMEADKEEWD
jgi:hypothetical protein